MPTTTLAKDKKGQQVVKDTVVFVCDRSKCQPVGLENSLIISSGNRVIEINHGLNYLSKKELDIALKVVPNLKGAITIINLKSPELLFDDFKDLLSLDSFHTIVSDTAITEDASPETILSILNQGARSARRIAKERRQYVQPNLVFMPPSMIEILEDLMYTQENTGGTGIVTNSKSVMQHFRDSNDWIDDVKGLEALEADVLAQHGLPHAPRILYTTNKPLPSGTQPLRFLRNQPFMMLQPKEIEGWGEMAFAGTMRVFGNIILREQALTMITFPEVA